MRKPHSSRRRGNIESWSSDNHAAPSPTPSPGEGGRLVLNPAQSRASSSPPPHP